MDPVIRIDSADIADTIGVLELCRLRRDQHVKCLAVHFRVVGPIGLDRVPELFEPFLIGIAVLHDEGGDALGMLEGETPAYGRAIVHHVHRVPFDTDLIEQSIDKLSETIEGVGKGCAVRHVALPVARVVGGDHVIAVGDSGIRLRNM